MASDLMGALQDFARTDGATLAAIPGGIFQDRAKSRATKPYAVAKTRHGSPEFVSNGSTYFDDRLEIRVYDTTPEGAAAASKAINDEKTGTLRNRPYYFDAGSTIPFFEQDRGSGEEMDLDGGGDRLHWVQVEYKARTAR